MKLIKHTYAHSAVWLIPAMVIGGLFCFFMIEWITYEETDEYLTYEMERLLNYHEQFDDLPDFHKVADIIPDLKFEKPFFKDTLLLEPGDNEMIPHRELWFSINHSGQDFTIVLRHLLIGQDDIIRGTLLIIAGIMLLIALFVLLMINTIAGKIWKPFYQTLYKLVNFKITDPLPDFPATRIDEFKSLNSTLEYLLKKITGDYKHNKEFNENIAHELQTHLAIIRANTEKLINQTDNTEKPHHELKRIYTSVTGLSQVQRSLLLLSKIRNREYHQHEDVDLQPIVEQALEIFAEAISLRGISVHRELAPCHLFMDAGLAGIMADNLVKNAVKHNIRDGFIKITLSPSALLIENKGLEFRGKPEALLDRFSTGKDSNAGSTGIGLSIVSQICELYNFRLSYTIKESIHCTAVFFGERKDNTISEY